jgi:hypothetical protein
MSQRHFRPAVDSALTVDGTVNNKSCVTAQRLPIGLVKSRKPKTSEPARLKLRPQKRLERPDITVGAVSKNVDVVIVGAQFEECIVRAVPLIDDLLHNVFTPIEFEAHGTLVCLHS